MVTVDKNALDGVTFKYTENLGVGMEDYELVEKFEASWRDTPKEVPVQARVQDEIRHALFLSVGGLQVYLELYVGVKGGIQELIYVFDPAQRIVADRLLVKSLAGGGSGRGVIVSLDKLRDRLKNVKRGRQAFASGLCEEALWDLLEEFKRSPLDPKTLRSIPSTSQSLRGVLRGGLPSQGRRGGGARGSH